MNFSYLNTIEDYVEAAKITRHINTLYKFFVLFLPWFIFSIIGVVLFFDIKSSGGTFAQLLIIALTVIVFTFCNYFYLPKRIDKIMSKKLPSNKKLNKNISVERKLTLTDEKVLISIKDKNLELKLEDILRVDEQNGRLFVITRFKNIVTTIPIYAFSSSMDKDEFINKITNKSRK